MSKVIEFSSKTELSNNPEIDRKAEATGVLKVALDEDLEGVVLLGIRDDESIYYATTTMSESAINLLVDRFKLALLLGELM